MEAFEKLDIDFSVPRWIRSAERHDVDEACLALILLQTKLHCALLDLYDAFIPCAKLLNLVSKLDFAEMVDYSHVRQRYLCRSFVTLLFLLH